MLLPAYRNWLYEVRGGRWTLTDWKNTLIELVSSCWSPPHKVLAICIRGEALLDEPIRDLNVFHQVLEVGGRVLAAIFHL